MSTKLFIGSLSWGTNDANLQAFFAVVGTVVSAKVITDRYTGKSRGFGFVEMETTDEANAAIQKLHDLNLHERNLRVSLAQERQDRPSGSGRPERSGERREYRGNSDYNSGGGSRSSYGSR